MLDVINRLLTVEADLVVTVTSPHDRRRPGNEEDRIRLRNLVAEARARVLDRWSPRRARRLLEHLDQAAAGAELLTGAHGVVLVATAEGGEEHPVPLHEPGPEDRRVDEAGIDSFPASDPPSWWAGTTA